MDIESLTKIFEYMENLPVLAQWLIMLPTMFIIISRILELNEYKINRKNATISRTLSFYESITDTIKHEAISNCTQILMDHNGGQLTEDDKTEIILIRFVINESLDNKTKNCFKDIFFTNGYYKRVKDNEDISDLELLRSTELRNISADAVNAILRPDSPLVGMIDQRFSYERSKELFKKIIKRHVEEIDSEVDDVNSEAERLFGGFAKIYKYKHRSVIVND